MRDLNDNVVHVFTRKEKAEKIVNFLQEENPKMLIQITEDIPAAALARALKKKGNEAKAIAAKEQAEKDLADNKDNVDFAKAASQLAEAAARLKTIQKLRKKI